MKKPSKFRIRSRHCKDCFWESTCDKSADHAGTPYHCSDFLFGILPPEKPNFLLYLAGDLAYCSVAVFAAWFGLKYDNAAAFFISGAFSVHASNLNYEYQQRLREYNWWCLEKQKQEELEYV